MKNYLLLIFLGSLTLLQSCGSEPESEKREPPLLATPNYNGEKLSIGQAMEKGYVSLSGNGRGTFRKIEIAIQNNLNQPIFLDIQGGLYFSNPKSDEQSLLTIEAIENLMIDAEALYTKEMPSVCTNVSLRIPGEQTNWPGRINTNGSIDEILRAYSKYKKNISEYVKRKNPEKFQSPDDQQRFLQVLVWAYSDAEYEQILNMLANDIYGNDITKAKEWLNGIYEQAKEIVNFIKAEDYSGLALYLGLEGKVEEVKSNFNLIKSKAIDRIRQIREN